MFAESAAGAVEMFPVTLLECKYVRRFQTATGGYKSESARLHFDVEELAEERGNILHRHEADVFHGEFDWLVFN